MSTNLSNVYFPPGPFQELREACDDGRITDVRRLIRSGMSVNEPDLDNGLTPLMIASDHGYTIIVELLIGAQADVNAFDDAGWTALMYASYHGHMSVVEKLIRAYADVNAAAFDGMTPLMVATIGGHADIVEALLRAHANFHVRDNAGWTAVRYAMNRGDRSIVELIHRMFVPPAFSQGFVPVFPQGFVPAFPQGFVPHGNFALDTTPLDRVPIGSGVPGETFLPVDAVSFEPLRPETYDRLSTSERSYYITKDLPPDSNSVAHAWSASTIMTLLGQSPSRSPLTRELFSIDDVRVLRSTSRPTAAAPVTPAAVPQAAAPAARIPLGGRSRCPAGYARNRRDRTMCVKK